jgi:hemoglobin-like flavoprotein
MSVQPVIGTLEAAALHGDLTERVYRRLFARHPEMEAQFVRDKDGSVRGEMLAKVFEIILDMAEGQPWAARMIQCEVVTHDGYGVPPDVFGVFFQVVADEIEALLGDAWTAADAAAWASLLKQLDWFATHPDQSLPLPVG